jgi:proteasome-associated ATPase
MQHGHPGSQPDEGGELNQGNNSAELTAQIRFLEDEIASLRR